MKIVAITSGKGGVGKTTLVTQLALQLVKMNQRVLIIDGDMGLANVDIQFGVRPKATMSDLVFQQKSIKDCITPISKNLDLIAGGSGLVELTQLTPFQRREIINQVQELQYKYDIALVDTSSGIFENVLHFNAIADECLVIITPEATSFTDAYALIKVLHQKYKLQTFNIVCNQIRHENGAQIFLKFSEVVEKFMNLRLHYLGALPYDENFLLPYSIQQQKQRVKPSEMSKLIIQNLAQEILSQSINNQAKDIYSTIAN